MKKLAVNLAIAGALFGASAGVVFGQSSQLISKSNQSSVKQELLKEQETSAPVTAPLSHCLPTTAPFCAPCSSPYWQTAASRPSMVLPTQEVAPKATGLITLPGAMLILPGAASLYSANLCRRPVTL